MLKGKNFYHQHIRKAIIAFGTIFNNIVIERKNTSGVIEQSIRVPLAYSTKQKFLSRIEQIPTVESRGEVAIVLPRMGFEITSLQYDASRKISQINKHIKSNTTDALSVKRQFVSTPYDLNLSLYIFAKNQEDGLGILEQILPYFNPDFNITINDLPEMDIKRDIKVVLDNINYEDNTSGTFAARQSIVWTLNFNMKLNFYGHVANEGIIRRAIANAFTQIDTGGEGTKITASVQPGTATATATISSGSIDSINLTYAGTGYVKEPNVTIEGNGRAHAVMIEDRIKEIIIDDVGSGYVTAPAITIESPLNGDDVITVEDPYRFLVEFDRI